MSRQTHLHLFFSLGENDRSNMYFSPNFRSKFWAFTHKVLEFLTIFACCHTFYQFVEASPKRTPQIYGDFPSLERDRGLARHILE